MSGIDVISNIGPVVPQLFVTEGVRTWNQECPLLSMLQMEQGRTQYVSWAVSNSGATGGFIAEKDNINTATEYNVNDRTKAQLGRAIARTGFGFSHTELAVVASLDRDVAADFVLDRLKDAWLESLSFTCRLIEQKLCGGTGTETSISTSSSVTGINGILSSAMTLNAGGSYAGLTTSYAGMKPYVAAIAGSNVVQKDFDLAFAAIQNAAGGITPDFIMCSPNTAVAIKNTFGDTNVRLFSIEEAAKYELGTRGVATASRPMMSYNGVPVIINSAWHQAGYDGYALIGRRQDIALDILPYAGWGDSVQLEHKDGVASFDNQVTQLGLPFFCYAPGKLGANVTFAMELELQLRVKAFNRLAVVYNIA